MKRESRSLAVVLFWATLLATAGGLAVSRAASDDEAAGRTSVMRAVRRVHVHRVWGAPGMESDPKTGISLYAHVEALGLKWRSLLVEVRLRTPDGKPVPVAAGAPEGYADKKGLFYMSTWAPILDDRFEWKELRASCPYEKVLDLPPGRPRQLIAQYRVSSSGLSSISEAEITVPPGPDPGVKRAVRLLAIDPFPNSLPPEDPTDSTGHERESGCEGATRIGRAREGRGLAVEAYVEAVGLERSKITGRFSLRRKDGRPLTSKHSKTGTRSPFESLVESDIVSDQAQILPHFVGYDAVGLGPGRHRLIFTYSASCQGLTAVMEEEHLLRVPTSKDDGRERPASK